MENEKMDRDVEKILTTIKKFSRINQWSKIDDSSQIQCARFSFGFVNDIIRCSICPDAKAQLFDVDLNQTIDDVVFKFFAEFDWLGIDRTELAMINTVVSQEGISPKLIYFDKNCQVNEFIKSHTYCYEDDCDEETVRKLASLLAHLHSLIDIPISDDGHTRLEKIWSDDTSGLWDSNQIIDLVRTKMNESQLERYVSISTIDVKECRTFLRQLISKIDSPLVFSHNDFNRGNRLVQCDESENKRIYLVDFDYANYFARGQDIGRYFSNYRHKDDMFGDEGFPTDQQMDLFIEEYRKEFAQRTTNGLQWFNDQRNSREKFRSEAKIYAMKAYLDDCLFGLMMFHLQSEEKFLSIATKRYQGFLRLKKMFIEDGTIENVR